MSNPRHAKSRMSLSINRAAIDTFLSLAQSIISLESSPREFPVCMKISSGAKRHSIVTIERASTRGGWGGVGGEKGEGGPDITGCFFLPAIIKSVDEEETKAVEESSSLSPPPFTLERRELRRARRAPNGMTVVKRKLSSWGEQSGNRH